MLADPLDSLREELESLQAAGLRRTIRTVRSGQGPVIDVDGRRVLNFCSNDYLGLASHPALVDAVRGSLDRGFGSGAARLIAGTVELHHILESELATWLGVERALLFNSGYQANVGIVSALVGPGDAVFSDALNHASLIDGCRLSRAQVHVYPHLDHAALDHQLAGSKARRKLVITESLFSMDGDTADLGSLRALADRHGALLVVDDAHAVGVFGVSGRGCVGATQAHGVVGTLGKAFGSFGAYVAGAASVVELVLQRARSFVFSTALPGAVSAASSAALRLIRGPQGDALRTKILDRVGQFREGIAALELETRSTTQIQPLLVGDPHRAVELARALYEEGVFALAIRPPTVPRGTSRLRVTLRADHSEDQIRALLRGLERHRHWLASA